MLPERENSYSKIIAKVIVHAKTGKSTEKSVPEQQNSWMHRIQLRKYGPKSHKFDFYLKNFSFPLEKTENFG